MFLNQPTLKYFSPSCKLFNKLNALSTHTPIKIFSHNSELMLAERTKLLNQESRRKAASVQSLTDKMSRLTNRKVTLQKPYLAMNEYGSANGTSSGDKNEKVVNNHSNISSNKSKSSTEGKRIQQQFD